MIQELLGVRKVEILDLTHLLLEREEICLDLDVFSRKCLSFFKVLHEQLQWITRRWHGSTIYQNASEVRLNVSYMILIGRIHHDFKRLDDYRSDQLVYIFFTDW